eukprot:TRINITY_DN12691_c0_g2_i5.p1 TRINITY_DN12691_c0_g2~~TRINITY_DN12691_c0_g2_i5.p1  ORF type:complete len:110 (-),score=7.51 TRINITY_DN12691_c0_g2_i5:138-467(-)
MPGNAVGSAMGGRRSTASQLTNRELAPQDVARKVPVPMDRECKRETARPSHGCSGEASKLSHASRLGRLQQQSHAVSACSTRQLNGAHSLHASLVAPLRDGDPEADSVF